MGSSINKWTNEEIEFLKNNYHKSSIREMANALGRSYNATKSKVFKFGVSDSSNKRGVKIYSCNEDYFSDLNPNSCYWAGFILADGYGSEEKRTLNIKLAAKDLSQIEKFKSDINFNGKIYHNKNQNQYGVLISSEKIIKDLKENFDIEFKNKTYTAKPPTKLTEQQKLAFLVGLIDGDGSINVANFKTKGKYFYSKNRISLIGTREVCEWTKKIFEDLAEEKIGNLFQVKSTKCCYTIATTGRKADLIISKLRDVECNHMERKWKTVEKKDPYGT